MKKIEYLNHLRCIAIFCVIIIHTTPIGGLDINDKIWLYNLPFNAVSRCGVPLFFMISGSLFLNHGKDMNFIYIKKKIIRLLLSFIVFSFIYSFLWYISKYGVAFNRKVIINYFIPNLLVGKYHLWYLEALIALYIFTPLLRLMTNNRQKVYLELYMLLSFLSCSLFPFLYQIMGYSYDMGWIDRITANIAFHLPDYSLYFTLGFFISQYVSAQHSFGLKCILGGGH